MTGVAKGQLEGLPLLLEGVVDVADCCEVNSIGHVGDGAVGGGPC